MTVSRQKPVVALSMRITEAPHYPERRDAISHDWIKLLEAWGVIPAPVPNVLADAASYLDRLQPDILILTGGDDIGTTPERDVAETAMLDHALETGLPVFGVCRGLEIINTHLGGSLIDLEGHAGKPHEVSVSPPWVELYGETPEVNSFHALGIAEDGMAAELTVAARDDENRVEAFYHRDKPLAAVMWHPERGEALEGDRLLIMGLVEQGAFWN